MSRSPRRKLRHKGGQFGIHEHDEQAALLVAGLIDEFRAIIHEGTQASRVLDRHGGDLRRILVHSLPPDTVRWRRKVNDVAALGDGRHELTFADGSTITSRLLVGADGAWSKARKLLSAAEPAYTGTSFVETYLYDVDARHAVAARAVGNGASIASEPGEGIFAHREPGNVLHAYIALNRPAAWFAAIDFDDAAAATARIAAEFEGWAPALTALIKESEAAPVLRMLHTLPTGHRWRSVPGVTPLGDAAHLAPPAGEGANLAMLDGAEIAAVIAAHPDDTEAALAAYEVAMFPRSQPAAMGAHQILALLLGERSPLGLVDFFTGAPSRKTAQALPNSVSGRLRTCP